MNSPRIAYIMITLISALLLNLVYSFPTKPVLVTSKTAESRNAMLFDYTHQNILNRHVTETPATTTTAASTLTSPTTSTPQPTETIVLVPIYDIILFDYGKMDYGRIDYGDLSQLEMLEMLPTMVEFIGTYLPVVNGDVIEWRLENKGTDPPRQKLTEGDKLIREIIELIRKYRENEENTSVKDIGVQSGEDLRMEKVSPNPTHSSNFSSKIIQYFVDNNGNPCVEQLIEWKTRVFHRYTCEMQGRLSEGKTKIKEEDDIHLSSELETHFDD